MKTSARCRLTGEPLDLVLDLGQQPLGNGFVEAGESHDEFFYRLACGFNESSRLFQLFDPPSPEQMFHDDYAFASSTSAGMATHFESLATAVLNHELISQELGLVVEIGCNDGILLRHFAQRGIRHLGIEPADGVARLARDRGVEVMGGFFSRDLADRVISQAGQADVILAANVLCHIPDIVGMAQGIAALLSPNGLLVFEDPYLGSVLESTSYDQIYDEHVFLFSALSVTSIFAEFGLELIDVEHQPTHGGSLRYTLAHTGQFQATPRVGRILARERAMGMAEAQTFVRFSGRIEANARTLREVLERLHDLGKEVAAFGATSKSTTVYNYAGIGPDLIGRIFDNTPTKIGKLSPGVHIPIEDSTQFSASAPDVAYLAAWNHAQEVLTNNRFFAQRGGEWLTHVPNVRFLKSDDSSH